MAPLKALFASLLFVLPAYSWLGLHYKRDLNGFVTTEKATALSGVLANIGPNGTLSMGASAGVVIASPSTVNPNYLYTWSRDSALTMKTLIDEFIGGQSSLQSTIENYIIAQAVIQTIISPSGSLQNGSGLGEPKFEINETAFKGSWGRPQRDGPALRAIALMSYINYLLNNGGSEEAQNKIWPIIANDLAYVGQYWNQTGFDLWEEVSGSSFFTLLNQHRALVQGAQMAPKLGKSCDACTSQAPQVLCFLESFWNGTSVVANINTQTVRSGRDANTLLAAIATFDPDGSCTDGTYQPCNSKILASHKVLVDSFRDIYTVNSNRSVGTAAAVGRYPEDVYYGGNPWYLCTLAAAEVLYDAIAQWNKSGSLCVDSISQPFFKDLYPSAQQQVYTSNTSEYNAIVSAVQTYADGFVTIVENILPSNGSISEQFSRNSSQPLSAYDLTWSFASFVTMAQRRSGYYPPSWGSTSASPAPSNCSGTSVTGTYAPATAAGAPNITCTVTETFRVNASTYYGENILLTGNTTDLGLYIPTQAWGLSAAQYSTSYPLWTIDLSLPPNTPITYQYVRQEADGSYLFETVNRTLTTGSCGAGSKTVNDVWTGPTGTPPSRRRV